jgi:hypothetical protein
MYYKNTVYCNDFAAMFVHVCNINTVHVIAILRA